MMCVGAGLSTLESFLGVESATVGGGSCSNHLAMRPAKSPGLARLSVLFFGAELRTPQCSIRSHSDED